MRKFLTGFLLTASLAVMAQYSPTHKAVTPSNFYLDFSSGIDNHSGLLGIGFQMPFNSEIGLRGGLGFGAWGGKMSIGMKYQKYQQRGWGVGLGYSHCPGISDLYLDFEDQNGNTNQAHLELLQVGTLNFTVNRNWPVGDNLVFFMESGYAFYTGGSEYYRVKGSYQPNPNEEAVLRIMRPGGLILALGLLVGI